MINDLYEELLKIPSFFNNCYDVKNPFGNLQKSLQAFNEKIDKLWWAIVLETKSETEWINGQKNRVKKHINSTHGFEFIKSYIGKNVVDYKYDEAIKAYDVGLYYASACTLATLIEKQLIQYDIITSTRLKKRFEKLLSDNDPWIYARLALERFYGNYTMDTRNTQFSFDKTEPPFLNRHWLLHGRMNRVITEFDCLQLFCALYAIIAIENDDI